MRLLLLNNNPAVSRLIKLSAEKAGYELDEFEDYGLVPLSHYDIILIDNELYDENALAGLKEYTGCDYVVYICQRGSKKPDTVNVVLEKPFLPTDFLVLLDKLKTVIESHKAEEAPEENEEEPVMPQSAVAGETSDAFDIDQIDTLETEEDMLPINLLEEDDDAFKEEETLDTMALDALEMDDVSAEDELLETKIPEEKALVDDEDEFSFEDTPLLDTEEESEISLDGFDFEEEEKASFDEDEDLKEEEVHNPSILDKDDIDEVKQLLDESDAQEEEAEISELSLDALDEPLDDAGKFFFDEDEKEEEQELVLPDESLELKEDEASELNLEDVFTSTDDEKDEEESEESLKVEEDQEEIIDDFTEVIDEKIEEEKELALEEEELLPQANASRMTLETSDDIDSLDDLDEAMLKHAFGESVEEETPAAPSAITSSQANDIEVIRHEIESGIARSISTLSQSDILREALKGMRLNISITFDEKE